jgi:hypothetical protein
MGIDSGCDGVSLYFAELCPQGNSTMRQNFNVFEETTGNPPGYLFTITDLPDRHEALGSHQDAHY